MMPHAWIEGRRLMRPLRRFLCALLILNAGVFVAEGRVTRIQIASREPFADGTAFSTTGGYEKIRGTVFFEVDPADSRNQVVFDVDKAPRNSRGMVEFSADIYILKPLDMSKGNGALLAEVANRGNKTTLGFFNDASPAANGNNPSVAVDAGNGFLFRQGYTLAWVGWSPGIIAGGDRLAAQFPIAMQDGKPITGSVLTVYWDAEFGGGTLFTLPLSGFATFKGYEAVSTNQMAAQAELRVRPSDSDRSSGPAIPAGTVVPATQWSFASCPNGPPGSSSTTDICLAGGFQNNQVYEVVYQATGSPVSGLGYVTTRDFISFLRKAAADDAGTPNPVAGISRTLCHGISISGQYLRDFVYQGFNEDEQGEKVVGPLCGSTEDRPELPVYERSQLDPISQSTREPRRS